MRKATHSLPYRFLQAEFCSFFGGGSVFFCIFYKLQRTLYDPMCNVELKLISMIIELKSLYIYIYLEIYVFHLLYFQVSFLKILHKSLLLIQLKTYMPIRVWISLIESQTELSNSVKFRLVCHSDSFDLPDLFTY